MMYMYIVPASLEIGKKRMFDEPRRGKTMLLFFPSAKSKALISFAATVPLISLQR